MRVEGFCIYCGEEQLETSYWRAGNAYFVRCKNCKATGPSIASTEEEAIKLFNIRHDAAKQMRLEYTKPTTLSQLQEDNAKLRDGAYAMRQLYEDELKHALADNAKLRKLAQQMYPKAKAFLQMGVQLGCNDTLSYDWYLQLRDLGVEGDE